MERESASTTAEELIFDANLQEFAVEVSTVCAPEAGGKISREEAYERFRTIWKQLKTSKKNLIRNSD